MYKSLDLKKSSKVKGYKPVGFVDKYIFALLNNFRATSNEKVAQIAVGFVDKSQLKPSLRFVDRSSLPG